MTEKFEKILKNKREIQKGDSADLYLKSFGLDFEKYKDLYSWNSEEGKISSLVVPMYACFLDKEKSDWNNEKYRWTKDISAFYQVFLTKEGRLRPVQGNISNKITVINGNVICQSHFIKLERKTEKKNKINNNTIYVVECFENALILHNKYDVEVWCCLDRGGFLKLPYENDKIYKFILKDVEQYNYTIDKLKDRLNKHFFYLDCKNKTIKDIPEIIPEIIPCQYVIKQNKRAKRVDTWRPSLNLKEAEPVKDELVEEFIGLGYDSKGLAERFVRRYGEQYRKVAGVGIVKKELGVWKVGKEDELFQDIFNTVAKTIFEWDYLTDKELQESFKKLWIKRGVGEFKTIDCVEQFIRRLPELNTDIEEFDKDNVINLSNGFFDLDKFEFFKHNENTDKKFFKQLPIEFKKGSKGNDWIEFLNSTFDGDKQKIRYLQKAIGYTFSTSVKEEKIFIIQGVTRSGKNTFLDTIQEVMSDYCGDLQDEEFITSRDQNNNYLLSVRASLKGKRFLHISEISKNKKLNSAQIKRLVGNRRISAKFMHQNSFSYRNQCKYWIATNNLDFSEFDESIKTKLAIINFDRQFYEEGTKEAVETGRVIDKNLKDRLITEENKQAILNWIIEGYWLYTQEGLNPTEEMKETLEEIERDNDSLGMFIKNKLETVEETAEYKQEKKTAKEIYNYYKTYEMNEYQTPEDMVMGFRKFIKNIRARGWSVKKLWCRNSATMDLFITNLKAKDEKLREEK